MVTAEHKFLNQRPHSITIQIFTCFIAPNADFNIRCHIKLYLKFCGIETTVNRLVDIYIIGQHCSCENLNTKTQYSEQIPL